ncbi:MAG: hypothetical protein WA142_08575 [Rugosibacter sp.]
MAQIALVAFPSGEKQITEETDQLHALLRGKLPKAVVRQLLWRTKSLLVIAEDKSEAPMIQSIRIKSEGKLTLHECKIIYQFLTGVSGALYDEGDGNTRESAIVINATSSIVGINAEYQWLTSRFGKQDQDWTIEMRMYGKTGDKSYETFVIELANESSKTVHFDISSFYGRF